MFILYTIFKLQQAVLIKNAAGKLAMDKLVIGEYNQTNPIKLQTKDSMIQRIKQIYIYIYHIAFFCGATFF